MRHHSTGLIAVVVILSMIAGAAASVGTAQAYHDHPEDASATFLPNEAEDRQPGATGTTFNIWAGQGLDYKADWLLVESPGLDWSDCSTGDLAAEGIRWRGQEQFDRPPEGDDTSTRTDESIVQYSKAPDYRKEGIAVNWYADEDLGGDAPRFNSTDEIVVQYRDCFNNPKEPGWYQMNVKFNGTDLETGERVSIEFQTHYYAICDCEDREEATEVLGPAPSQTEDSGGDSPTATATDESTPTTTAESVDESTPTATAESVDESTPTATAAPEDEDTTTAASDDTETADADDADADDGGDAGGNQPTPEGDGAGFGAVAPILALFGAVLLARRIDL